MKKAETEAQSLKGAAGKLMADAEALAHWAAEMAYENERLRRDIKALIPAVRVALYKKGRLGPLGTQRAEGALARHGAS